MTTERYRANLISSTLRGLLVVNILLFVSTTIWMFFTSSPRDVYLYGLISCSCLIASVGFQLLYRWQRLGLYVTVGIFVIVATVLYLYFHVDLTLIFGIYGVYIPFVIVGVILLLLWILLFAIKNPRSGKSCWTQMSNGTDIKHFRHIYQLSSIILIFIVSAIYFLHKAKANETPIIISQEITPSFRTVSWELLDSANVTLDEVITIESMADTIPEKKILHEKRIFALKHVLISGIMSHDHDPEKLTNILKVHEGDFSESQQEIVDWYLELSPEKQSLWIECAPVNNLTEFKTCLTDKINKK